MSATPRPAVTRAALFAAASFAITVAWRPAASRAGATTETTATTHATPAASSSEPTIAPPPAAATAPASPATAPASTPTAAATKDSKEIESLLAKFASDNWRERQTAQERLVRLLDAAVPPLERLAREATDEEVRTRAAAALSEITEVKLTGPTLVTLHEKDAPLKGVVERLMKQARGSFTTYPEGLLDADTTRLDLDADAEPFWAVMKRVCQKTGLGIRDAARYGNADAADAHRLTLSREAAAPMAVPSVVNGPLLVAAESVQSSSYIDLAHPGNGNQNCSVQLGVYAEPRFRVISGTLKLEKADDETGASLLRDDSQGGVATINGDGGFTSHASLSLRFHHAKKLALLRGELRLLIQVASETVEIDDILTATNVTRSAGGKRFTVNKVVVNDTQYQLDMTLFRDELSPAEWKWFSYPYGKVKFLDAKGKSLTYAGGGGSNDGTKATFTQYFSRNGGGMGPNAVGEPVKLVWELPTRTKEIVAPVEFKDLPLEP